MASPLVHAHLRLDVAAWCSCWTGTSTIKFKDSDPNIYMDSHYQNNNNNNNPFIALRQGERDGFFLAVEFCPSHFYYWVLSLILVGLSGECCV